jgi:hypothetical protein
MILVELIGGLGNQMFQYALGRSLSEKNKLPLKLDITGFNTYTGITPRRYELSCFKIKEHIATENDIQSFRKYAKNKVLKLTQKMYPYYQRKVVVEKEYRFDPRILGISESVYLKGYWQSEKYFKNIRNILLNEFSLKNNLDSKTLDFANQIQKTESVSIHFRRGDYVNDPKVSQIHGVSPIDYYNKAIARLLSEVNNPVFFIFSDDINWVKENFKLDKTTYYVDFNSSGNAYLDLWLMSLCKHQIIANSSFSWWGAWLNQNADKVCIMPQKWFNDPTQSPKDIRPEGWIAI